MFVFLHPHMRYHTPRCSLISSSWVISNFGLMSALAVCGPADGQGDIALIHACLGKVNDRANSIFGAQSHRNIPDLAMDATCEN